MPLPPGNEPRRLRRASLELLASRIVTFVADASPDGRRRSAIGLVVVLGAVGSALGLLLGGASSAVEEPLAAGALAGLVLAILLLPVDERFRWTAVVVLAPISFAIGLQPLETPEAFIGLFVVPIAWVAAFLGVRLVLLHTLVATVAVWWVLAEGTFTGRTSVAAAIWLVIFVSVAGLVTALARGLERAREEVEEIGDAVGIHFYRGVLHDDGTYSELYTGSGLERLLGGPLPPGADPGTLWNRAIHDEDLSEVNGWLREIEPGGSAERDYRLVGLDGVTRWVRDRTRVVSSRGGTVVHEGVVTDITERKGTEAAFALARRELEDVIETIDEVILRYVPGPDRWRATVTGPRLDELLGPLASQTPDPLDAAALALDRTRLAHHRERALREGRSEVEVRVASADGRRWVAERLRARQEPGGSWVVAATLTDVTERRLIAAELAAARDEAERRARTDALTNLANRLHFGELLDVAVDRHQRDGTPFSLILVDVDRFKAVNDEHGHLAGDDVLVEVAARLAARLRGADIAARWGGEEFAVLLHGADGAPELLAAAEGARGAITVGPVSAGGHLLKVTVSVGAALAGRHGRTADELLAAADAALYRAKAAGRNRVELAGDPPASAVAS